MLLIIVPIWLAKVFLLQVFADSNSWQFQGVEKQYSVLAFAGKIRNRLLETLKRSGLEGDEMAVASAILLGYGGNIETRFKKSVFRGRSNAHSLCFGFACWNCFSDFKLFA